MDIMKLGIGFKRDEAGWAIVYGDVRLVEKWIIMNASNRRNRVFGETYMSEIKMMLQLEYYKKEYANVEIHKVAEVLKEIA